MVKARTPRRPSLSNEEMTRYSRQLMVPELGPSGQSKLKGASVLVVGVGGLGVPAAVHLASAGVGRLGLVDSDSVELPNLHRQFIYSAEDVGRQKVKVARDRLGKVNPHTELIEHETTLGSKNALRVLKDYDVVVDATDNFPSRYLINDACVKLGKPDVFASVLRLEGQASVFFPPGGPCYRCLYPFPPPPETVQSCSTAGVLGVLTGIMGGIQAVQAINLIVGIGPTLMGRLMVFDATGTSFEEVRIKRNRSCPVCSLSSDRIRLIDYEAFCGTKKPPLVSVEEISPEGLKRLVESGSNLLLLDVREPFEYKFCHLEKSKLIPLNELRGRLGELDSREEIVVYCHTGVRSARAVSILKKEGFAKVRNLRGGIEGWREKIDPSIPFY